MTSLEFATKHLALANPTLWNGEGNPPENFNSQGIVYRVGKYDILNISFVVIKGKWAYYCDLRELESLGMMQAAHNYGINSPQALADALEWTLQSYTDPWDMLRLMNPCNYPQKA